MLSPSPLIPTLVCEVANSHGGDAAVLEALIDATAKLEYPKKAIKFQVFAADTIALPDFEWYSIYQTLAFDQEQWRELIKKSSLICDVWIDIFDLYGVEVLGKNLDLIAGLKLQASVLENQEVLSALGKLNLSEKTLAINVSGHGIDDIRQFISKFRSLSGRLILQIGFQSYPTAIGDTALQKISVLRAAYPECGVAMADHSPGGTDFAKLVPIYAHSLGCSIIEKHFCLDRASAPYDGFSALEPSEMQIVCDRLIEFDQGRIGAFVNANERKYLDKSIQLPVVRRRLTDGNRINSEDVVFRRTAQHGLSWPEIDSLQRARSRLATPLSENVTVQREDFRPARVGALIACRMKSTRLKQKALAPLGGVPSVERCLVQCLDFPGIDEVILATSDLAEDQILQQYTCNNRAAFWSGDADDVITRYVGACEAHGIDVVVRVTADCPVISREIMAVLLEEHFNTGADYTASRNSAVGTSAEIIEVSALRKVISHLGRAEHSEYMTWYFQNNPDIFKLKLVDLPPNLVRDYRLTLDYQEDHDVLNEIFDRLAAGYSPVALADVFEILDRDPGLAKRNGHIELKYRTDQSLINLLDQNTRIWTDT